MDTSEKDDLGKFAVLIANFHTCENFIQIR